MPATQQDLIDAFVALQEARTPLKELRAELKESLQGAPGYEERINEAKEARAAAKLIEDQVAESTGIKARIDDARERVNAARDLVSDITVELMQTGQLKGGDPLRVGQKTLLIPKVRVTYKTEQLAIPGL